MATTASSGLRRAAEAPRLENPFNVKVFQVFTGVGVGCGVGVGVGRPIHLGAIPALQQVMSAARGATDAFSGVGRHVNSTLRKLGLKNIEAGVGCGVGIGHGFGVGLALKPRVVRGIQSSIGELMSKMMANLKDVPGLSSASNIISESLPRGISSVDGSISTMQNSNGTPMELEYKASLQEPTHRSYEQKAMLLDETTGSQTEKVIADFLQNPLFKNDTEMDLSQGASNLQAMNNVLQVLLQHQRVIEELKEENQKLREILVEELSVPPSKLQINHESRINTYYPCSDCFECRRRSRKTMR